MNDYIGEFSKTDRLTLDTLFSGWTFKHVGHQRDIDMEFFYAYKDDMQYGARTLSRLSKILILNHLTKDDE